MLYLTTNVLSTLHSTYVLSAYILLLTFQALHVIFDVMRVSYYYVTLCYDRFLLILGYVMSTSRYDSHILWALFSSVRERFGYTYVFSNIYSYTYFSV